MLRVCCECPKEGGSASGSPVPFCRPLARSVGTFEPSRSACLRAGPGTCNCCSRGFGFGFEERVCWWAGLYCSKDLPQSKVDRSSLSLQKALPVFVRDHLEHQAKPTRCRSTPLASQTARQEQRARFVNIRNKHRMPRSGRHTNLENYLLSALEEGRGGAGERGREESKKRTHAKKNQPIITMLFILNPAFNRHMHAVLPKAPVLKAWQTDRESSGTVQ